MRDLANKTPPIVDFVLSKRNIKDKDWWFNPVKKTLHGSWVFNRVIISNNDLWLKYLTRKLQHLR